MTRPVPHSPFPSLVCPRVSLGRGKYADLHDAARTPLGSSERSVSTCVPCVRGPCCAFSGRFLISTAPVRTPLAKRSQSKGETTNSNVFAVFSYLLQVMASWLKEYVYVFWRRRKLDDRDVGTVRLICETPAATSVPCVMRCMSVLRVF